MVILTARPFLALAVFAALAPAVVAGQAHAQRAELVVETAMPAALRAQLEAALPEHSPARSTLEARRQAERAGEAIRLALNADAYFDPEIAIAVRAGPPPRPMVRVDPGAQFTVRALEIEWQAAAPVETARSAAKAAIQIAIGAAAIPEDVIASEAAILLALRQEGYPYPDAEPRRVKGDRETGTVDIVFRIRPGPRVRLGEIRPPQDIRTRPNYVRRLRTFEPGQLYDPNLLSRYTTRLSSTRAYDRASALLAEAPSGTAETGEEIRDVVVRLEERPRNWLGLGASYSTGEGAGVVAEWERRNLTGRADTLTLETRIAQLERGADAEWRRPHQYGYGRDLIFDTFFADETTDAFDSRSAGFGARLEVNRHPNFNYSFGAQGRYISEDLGEDTRDVQLLIFNAAANLNRADDVLDPTEGWRLEGLVQPTAAFGDTSGTYARASIQARGYLPVATRRRLVLAARARIGSTFGAELDDLPTDSRFFAGGGGSVRGYAFQAIGPRTTGANSRPLGGRSLLDVSAEARLQMREKIGVVAFIDGGNVSEDQLPGLDSLRYGAGLGVRYATPAGPLRLDVAVPLDKTDFDESFQVYVSIGQAF